MTWTLIKYTRTLIGHLQAHCTLFNANRFPKISLEMKNFHLFYHLKNDTITTRDRKVGSSKATNLL